MNRPCRLLYGQPRQPIEWNYFPGFLWQSRGVEVYSFGWNWVLPFDLELNSETKNESLQISQYLLSTDIHTIWSLQPFSQDYELASHTTYVVCINFIHKWRDLQFKSRLRKTDFWEAFHGSCIYSQSFCRKTAAGKEVVEEIFSYFCFDVWPGVWTRAIWLISQQTTYFTTTSNSIKFNCRSFHIWYKINTHNMRDVRS